MLPEMLVKIQIVNLLATPGLKLRYMELLAWLPFVLVLLSTFCFCDYS